MNITYYRSRSGVIHKWAEQDPRCPRQGRYATWWQWASTPEQNAEVDHDVRRTPSLRGCSYCYPEVNDAEDPR